MSPHQTEPSPIPLSRLLQDLVLLSRGSVPETEITAITDDSRKVKPGTLFVAIRGYQTDGHQYIRQALDRGAAGVIAESDSGFEDQPVCVVNNTREALAKLTNCFYGYPAAFMTVIGITGTNGKTTISYLLESIFECAGKNVGRISTTNYHYQGHDIPASRTTPDILELQSLFFNMKQEGVNTVVMEVSSHALFLDRVLGIPFSAGIYTNLSRDHLDFHPTIEDYRDAKSMLFKMLDSDAVAVINRDDAYGLFMQGAAKCRVATYGRKETQLTYRIGKVEHVGSQSRFDLIHQGGTDSFTIHLWGDYNISNATAAAATALEMGVDAAIVQKGLLNVKRVPGRMDGLETSLGFRVIIDYAHTPDALENVLRSAKEFTQARLITVFGAGGDRDPGKRPMMGEVATRYSDLTFVTSDNPRTEDPNKIIEDILQGIDKTKKTEVISDRRKAIERAIQTGRPGDVIVIAGKGHEDYQEIGHEKKPFDDRLVAKAVLESLEAN